ncbi:MAG: hypothetical protein AABY22_36605 [Nanoarchaeota archaeon]
MKNIQNRRYARGKLFNDLSIMLRALIVVDSNFKSFVISSFSTSIERMSKVKITESNWSKHNTYEFWTKEWVEVEKQIDTLNIFSTTFKQTLKKYWSDLGNTFNPNYNFKK